MEYVDQESKREVLEFWLGATNFAEQFVSRSYSQNEDSPIDVRVAQSDAMVLYEKYISLQAPQILGFRDEIRSDVERLICSQDEIAHCFDKAINEAFLYLHVTCLDGFLKSSLFLAFLTDLINSLGPSLKTHKRSESTSTCSSSSASLTSPVAQNNVSSLHQSGKSKLCLGRVNSMGKFEADTDLELLKHESGIAKTMKKLVNFDEKEKAKEELAWQVAAMIVNEVTSITMGTGDSSNVAQ
jgi:A-kinase anchor protein 10